MTITTTFLLLTHLGSVVWGCIAGWLIAKCFDLSRITHPFVKACEWIKKKRPKPE